MYKFTAVSALGLALGSEIVSLAIIACWACYLAGKLLVSAAEHGM